MSLLTRCVGTVFLTFACLSAAHAAEFPVGRADVVFPTDDWHVAELPDPGAAYGGDRHGVIPSEMKLFVKTGQQGEVQAVAVVRASTSGVTASYMTYGRRCESTDKVFAEGLSGDALPYASCLQVHPSYTTRSLLDHLGEPGKTILAAYDGKFPEGMHEVTSSFANSNGTFIEMSVWLAPGFAGIPGTVSEALPERVPASHVLWGRALHSAVRGSVTSIFGTLKFPALSFRVRPPSDSAKQVAVSRPPTPARAPA